MNALPCLKTKYYLQNYTKSDCLQSYELFQAASSVDGERYVYEHEIDQLSKTNSGSFSCHILIGNDWLNLTATEVYVFSFSIESSSPLVLTHGSKNVLICEAEHPAVSTTSTVKVTWYKGKDSLGLTQLFASDQDISWTLELMGTWADSASYRCLFEYFDPDIPPVFSNRMDVAYVGIYRSSVYRFDTTALDVNQDKLYLTKTTTEDLKLDCYLQTKKKAIEVDDVAFVVYDGSGVCGSVTSEADNSPFETASRFKVSTSLTTSVVGDVTVGCQYTFDDADQTSQSSKFAVRTVLGTGVYVKSYPSDMMFPFSKYSAFMDKTSTVWNKQLNAALNFNFDDNFNVGGVNSDFPATTYADWAKIFGDSLGSSTCSKTPYLTTCTLSSDYASMEAAKTLTSYKSNMIMSSTVQVATEYFAAPTFVGYVPTIQTTNGTKVHAEVFTI